MLRGILKLSRLAAKLGFAHGTSLENLWLKKQFPELFFIALQVPSKQQKTSTLMGACLFCWCS